MLHTQMNTIHQIRQGMDFSKTVLLLDVDECLIQATVRDMPSHHKNILWGLHDVLDGRLVLLTNSDMRGIDKMLPGIPCVSEFGSNMRLEYNGSVTRFAPELDADGLVSSIPFYADHCGVETTTSAHDLQGVSPVLKVEAKESSIALVYGKHTELKEQANEIAKYLYWEGGLDKNQHQIYNGPDAVEIKPIGFAKEHAIDAIMNHPNFKGCRADMYGDSSADLPAMREVFNKYNGHGFVVGNASCFDNEPCVAHRFNSIADNLRHLEQMYVMAVQQKYGRDSKLKLALG